MAKFYSRVTLITPDGHRQASSTLYKKKSRRRKVPRWAKPMERTTRRFLEAGKAFGTESLRRHNRSTRKKKYGWLKDGPTTMMRAQRKALKKLWK